MLKERKDIYRNFRFSIEHNGVKIGEFSEVMGFEIQLNSFHNRIGNEEMPITRKFPSLSKYGNITLKRGLITDRDMLSWAISHATQENPVRYDLAIKLYGEAGNEEVAFWQVRETWPVKYSLSEFTPCENCTLIEMLELNHEGITRIK
ncbi:MAG: phage tail protein [Clostridia bacterium]|nr:phage tail protein [Clostridia bacterium]